MLCTLHVALDWRLFPEHRFFYLYVNACWCAVLGWVRCFLCLPLKRGFTSCEEFPYFWEQGCSVCGSGAGLGATCPHVSSLLPRGDGHEELMEMS